MLQMTFVHSCPLTCSSSSSSVITCENTLSDQQNSVASFCRPELVAQAIGAKRSWFSSVAEVVQLRSVMEDELSQWSLYRGGLQLIRGLLEDIDCVLPPAGSLSDFPDDYQVRFDRFLP